MKCLLISVFTLVWQAPSKWHTVDILMCLCCSHSWLEAYFVTWSLYLMGPCWTRRSDWKWQKEQGNVSHLNGRLHGTSGQGVFVLVWVLMQCWHEPCHNMCLPFFDMGFKFLIYSSDIWQSKGKNQKRNLVTANNLLFSQRFCSFAWEVNLSYLIVN